MVIFENSDRISHEAQNSCLKLLEEPPSNVVLILLATRSQDLLTTLKSRCQLLTLGPISFQSMMSYLTDIKQLPVESAAAIAGAAKGLPGLADSLIGNDTWQGELDSKLTQFVELLKASIPERLRMVPLLEQEAGRSRDDIVQVLRHWMGWYREILRSEYSIKEEISYSQFNHAAERLNMQLSPSTVAGCIYLLNTTIHNIKMNANIRLSLERLVVAL